MLSYKWIRAVVSQRLYRGALWGLYRDNGNVYRDNGKENENYYNVIGVILGTRNFLQALTTVDVMWGRCFFRWLLQIGCSSDL